MVIKSTLKGKTPLKSDFKKSIIGLIGGFLTIGVLLWLTKTTHPPAGADALVVMMAGQGWNYLFSPVLIGSVIIVLMAVITNNLVRGRAYPSFWW